MLMSIRGRPLVGLITRRSCVRIASPLYKTGLELMACGSVVPILFLHMMRKRSLKHSQARVCKTLIRRFKSARRL